jgi:hypothetical protein
MKAQCIRRTAREGGFVPWFLGAKRVFERMILFGISKEKIFGGVACKLHSVTLIAPG